MIPISTTDQRFLATLQDWLREQHEIPVLIRYHAAAGGKNFEFFSSFHALAERLNHLPTRTSVIAFKRPQLSFRGIVDDDFIAKCVSSIPDGSEYLVVKTRLPAYDKSSITHWSAGESHCDLRRDLEEWRGHSVAVGVYPPWLADTEDVISAYVPDEDGVVRSGGY
jgi:hypothetical protein